jgi:hypothetical protein
VTPQLQLLRDRAISEVELHWENLESDPFKRGELLQQLAIGGNVEKIKGLEFIYEQLITGKSALHDAKASAKTIERAIHEVFVELSASYQCRDLLDRYNTILELTGDRWTQQ